MESSSGPSAGQCSPSSNPYAAKPYGAVAYIGGELGDFLLGLRGDVVPGCALRSHVSVLPPRPITGPEDQATRWLHEHTVMVPAFEVRLGKIEVFPGSNVIYVALEVGGDELRAAHDALNAGPFLYQEEYPYHPHVTLAQRIPETEHAGILRRCLDAWEAYAGPRTFAVETVSFVKNESFECWRDLAEIKLELAGTRR